MMARRWVSATELCAQMAAGVDSLASFGAKWQSNYVDIVSAIW